MSPMAEARNNVNGREGKTRSQTGGWENDICRITAVWFLIARFPKPKKTEQYVSFCVTFFQVSCQVGNGVFVAYPLGTPFSPQDRLVHGSAFRFFLG